MAQSVEVFEVEMQGAAPPLRLVIHPEQLSEAMIADLKGVLSNHHGQSQVYIHLNDNQAVKLSDEYCVETSNGLIPELRVLLGAEAVVL